MIDWYRFDAAALTDHQRRQEAVHVIEPRQGEKGLAREHLEPTSRIRRVVAEKQCTDVISEPRRDALEPAVAPLRPARRQVMLAGSF